MSKIFKKYRKLCFSGILVLAALAAGLLCLEQGGESVSLDPEEGMVLASETLQETSEGMAYSFADSADASDAEETSGEVFVHVCGQVAAPGVYCLREEQRVFEAIEAAGGLLPDADGRALNLALKVSDQMQIYVPSHAETENAPAGTLPNKAFTATAGDEAAAASEKININQATAAQLTKLPGIGDSKAADIIRYREEHGSFSSVEELMNVPGIKDGVFNKIKDQIIAD